MDTINYTDYLAETLNKSISYSEYLSEHNPLSGEDLEQDILKEIALAMKKGYKPDSYEAHLIKAKNAATAINRQKQIDCIFNDVEFIPMLIQNTNEYKNRYSYLYDDYIKENLEKSIMYSEYICENIDKTIEYTEYLAKNLNKI